MVENIVRKGEMACFKQFLLFSQCFPQLYIFSASNASLCSNGLKSFWKKEKMVVNSISSFPHSIFYPIKDKFCYPVLELNLNCCLQMLSIWTGLSFCTVTIKIEVKK